MKNDSNSHSIIHIAGKDTLHEISKVMEVRVPTELIHLLANSPKKFLRLISAWLVLKSITTSCSIKNYRKQLPALASSCKIAEGTFRIYLHRLAAENLLHVHKEDIFLHSYAVLSRYGIKVDKKQTILYKTTDDRALCDMIVSIAEAGNG
jgi:hypothetical protein